MECTLTVNGEQEMLHIDAATTLLEALRTQLQLTGAKRGCNQGVCGACTVLLDGQPVRGCLTLAANCGERDIRTIEGVSVTGAGMSGASALSAVQRALVEGGAVQCGFCIPGMVLTLEAFLREHPAPSAAEVRDALSGNLCRCSGYVKIVEAALCAAQAHLAQARSTGAMP